MSRTTMVLAGILVLQLVVWGITSIDRQHVTEQKPFLSQDTSQIDYVHIKNKDGEVTLQKVGGNWKVTSPYNFPANDSYTGTLVEKLAELKLESFITGSKDKWKDYEVDDSSAAYVEAGRQGGVMDKFYCGKPSKTYTHTYIRRAGSDDVWLVSGTPRSSFTRRPKDWRDKSILELDRTMIERVELKFPDETVTLVRDISSPKQDTTLVKGDTTWKVMTGKGSPLMADDKPLNRFFNTLSKLRALDFLDVGTDTLPDMTTPEFTVEVFLEGNQHEVVDFKAQPGEEKHWAVRKHGVESTMFMIYESSVKNLMKRAPEFKEEKKKKDEET